LLLTHAAKDASHILGGGSGRSYGHDQRISG
jgi:hypothetical protein